MVHPTGDPLTVAALKNSDIEGADLFTTLEGPKNNFPAQNVLPQ